MTKPSAPARIAHIDDHEAMRLGFQTIVAATDGFELVRSTSTVAELLEDSGGADLVVLDLRLTDGTDPAENVVALRAAGHPVLGFTGAEDPVAVRAAAAAGALGIVRKSDSVAVLVDAMERAVRREAVATTDWAAALDADPQLPAARLSPKEQQILALYASGEKTVSVAAQTRLSEKTVSEYVRRIRAKYAAVGRPAPSRVDLYKRAVEDGYVDRPGDGPPE